MFQPRPCGCKGIRTCLLCEAELGVDKNQLKSEGPISNGKVFEYCYLCNKAWEGSDVVKDHPDHSGASYEFPGVLLIPLFVSEVEEEKLVKGCDSIPWDLSQSGRRKQNFGPKTNFKKQKINGDSFNGFPLFTRDAQAKMKEVDFLKDFQTIEQCAIEYRAETGASIDPHIDDCWVWGERVISLSLLSDSVLTMNKFSMDPSKYNLKEFNRSSSTISSSVDGAGEIFSNDHLRTCPVIRIPMPQRSLLVLYGPARYEWEHSILRSDINDRRICMAYREFTTLYLKGGKYYSNIGEEILCKADCFGIHSQPITLSGLANNGMNGVEETTSSGTRNDL